MAKVSKLKKPVYDSTKNYQWKGDDIFEITGKEFVSLVNYFTKEIYHGPNAVNEKVECYSLLQEMLKTAVEEGVAIVKEPEATADTAGTPPAPTVEDATVVE